MRLFEVLPEQFFHLLTGTNKHLYAEALLRMFELSQREKFGVRLNVMRDLLQELIETHRELGLEISFDDEDNGRFPDSTKSQISLDELSRAQANAMIRRMAALKWIDIEVRDQFEEYIVLPHYSSRMLALFQELCEARAVEYQRFAFVTYEILTGQEAKRRPCFAVLEARRYTIEFEKELITLYNNMKHHVEQVVQKKTIQDVLDHHFKVYQSKIVDKSYHRLRTSDHVSRYSLHILETVQKWLLDRDLLEETITDGLQSQFYQSREEAEKDILDALHRIDQTYSGLDQIFNQIDIRHNQYLRSSYDRARYLSQQNQGLDQQLADVLEQFADIKEINSDKILWSELFRLQQTDLLTESSLFSPRRKRKQHQPEVHVVVPVSNELKKKLREKNFKRMRKTVTREKVERYVLSKLGNRPEMGLEELAPSNLQEFLFLAYVYLFGQDGASAFELKRSDARRILHIGPYRFTDHRIIRKRGRG
ncbi:Wadjet anti-phage system protein JetA family protein [Thermoactinomyces mirandus]|uniref:Uncharacterized protein n=1 Tax=Thermoactinomyces mirandus TaxID=2756294 RepID=A0A7W2AQ20_9BACL|nr:Wadjet anti-phage system protein JetA family protein [Thermoactinomyces mirandus]MBA4601534.1 hypothetical protein [Thermoactinomyces mirandus]